jgi:predicted ATP-dependent endonuclease of OLD family
LSTDCQLFITTHSPTFVDRADLNTVWISRFTNGETTFEKATELTEILGELGIKPSDVLFFANKILFVEGKTEEIVIPAFAQKLQVDLKDVAIIAVEGKTEARLNLKTWVKITVEYFQCSYCSTKTLKLR